MRVPFGWAPVALGTVAGLLLMVVTGFAATALPGLAGLPGEGGDTPTWTILSLALLTGEFAAGYVAGRLGAPHAARLNGSLAALGVFMVFAAFSLASGSRAGVPTLVLFLVVAAALGRGGGATGAKGPRGNNRS